MNMSPLFAAALVTSLFAACGKSPESKTLTKMPGSPSTATAQASEDATQTKVLRGLIQYESPCVLASFPNGCLRLWTADAMQPGGNLKYIDRDNRDNAGAEFNVVDNSPFSNVTTLYRLWYNSTDSVLLSHNQPVALTVELDAPQTTIINILDVSLTGHFNGE